MELVDISLIYHNPYPCRLNLPLLRCADIWRPLQTVATVSNGASVSKINSVSLIRNRPLKCWDL